MASATEVDEPAVKKQKSKGICIVHIKGLQHGELKMLLSCADPQERFRRIQNVKERRMAQAPNSVYRMKDICGMIPETLEHFHGYHFECYKRFTGNLNRLVDQAVTGEEPTQTSRPKRNLSDKAIFSPDCIFCNQISPKKVKKQNAWTTEKLCFFEIDGWYSVCDLAEKEKDEELLRRIRGVDLYAAKAKFHRSCRCSYLQDPKKWRSHNDQQRRTQIALEGAHKTAFTHICSILDDKVLQRQNFVTLEEIRKAYVEKLTETDFRNPDFRGKT